MPGVPYGAIAERRLIERLLMADAVGAGTAQPLENLRWIEARRLRRLIALGVVREAAAGRYYLYAPALAQRMASRRLRLLIALLAVVAAFVTILALAGSFRSS